MNKIMQPTLKHFVSISLPYTIVLLAFFTEVQLSVPNFPVLSLLGITPINWAVSFIILIIFFLSSKYFFDDKNKENMYVLFIYLIWMIISIVRGIFAAEIYWDWKVLVIHSFGLLLPVFAYVATNKSIVQSLLSSYIKYALPLFVLLSLIMITDAYGRYLMPISFLLFFLPAMSVRQRYLVLFFTLIVLISNIHARANLLKFSVPLILLVIYFLQEKISVKTLQSIRFVFFIAPFIFFTLAVTDTFNVFNMSEYLGDYEIVGTDFDGSKKELNLSSDNRTFLYIEVIESAINNDYWIFGRTPARGNDSDSFGVIDYELTGRDERSGNEVGILNIFTWTGIIGVILYMFVFYKASGLAINRSKNIYSKMLGVYVAFRWMFSWVEDINNFTLNYFTLWLIIGICFSYSFRSMTDNEVTIWVRGIFDNRYLNYDKYRKKEKNGR